MENNRKNLISAVIFQITSIISGLILPRLILSTFGSNINGLVSSITQFLSFISLLEGGLGAVVLAELYKPIEEKNRESIYAILNTCQSFFKKIAFLFFIFTLVLSIMYPIFISNKYSFHFTSTLILILSLSTLSQYLFAITYKLLLQADHKIYICNYVHSLAIILNLLLTVIVIKIWSSIHIVKIISSLVFLIQPIIYNEYVKKHYDIKINFINDSKVNKHILKQRWNGFAQNLAHFVNMNTDIILVTLFLSLSEVSVYSIYMLPVNALRSLITTASISYQSSLGRYIAKNDGIKLEKIFKNFDTISIAATLTIMCTCLILINPFVLFYTSGIEDVIYYRPYFALITLVAYLIYCIREPYRILILSAGKFKETNIGSILEAVINIVISIILINYYGLVGIAIGTLLAILFRYIYLIYFTKKNILKNSKLYYSKKIFLIIIFIVINIFIYFKINFVVRSFFEFCLYGVLVVFTEIVLFFILFLVVEKHSPVDLFKKIKVYLKRKEN